MSTLTLPGDIPGLLRRGSPVLLLGRRATVVGIPEHGWVCACHIDETLSVPTPLAALALDLTEATGLVHAAWWARPRFEDAWLPRLADGVSATEWDEYARASDMLQRCIEAEPSENDRDRERLRDLCLHLAGRPA